MEKQMEEKLARDQGRRAQRANVQKKKRKDDRAKKRERDRNQPLPENQQRLDVVQRKIAKPAKKIKRPRRKKIPGLVSIADAFRKIQN